jgi:uncharacterized membrane protein
MRPAAADRKGDHVNGSKLRLRGWLERLGSNLFLVPGLFVAAGVALGLTGIHLDAALVSRPVDFPLGFASTVESARAVLSTVAAATMTVAGVAFSIALLVFQLASTQYSPRVIQGLFRDGVSKGVLGLVVGTFTYCLVVLRAVHGPLDAQAEATVPTVSVAGAVVLGIASVLGVVAFISHSAHQMEVSTILHDVSSLTIARISQAWAAEDEQEQPAAPPTGALTIDLERDGWVQLVDHDGVLDAIGPGTTAWIEITVGRYAITGTPLCRIWPVPADDGEYNRLAHRVRRAVTIGPTRTLTQDVAYGVRQLVDVALRALSPGVNDPTTAQDAIFHTAAVLREMLVRRPPARLRRGAEGRRLVAPHQESAEELVDLAFSEVRRAAGTHPAVCLYLLNAIHLVTVGIGRAPAGRSGHLAKVLADQAAAVVDECRRAPVSPSDLSAVRAAYRHHFGNDDRTGPNVNRRDPRPPPAPSPSSPAGRR